VDWLPEFAMAPDHAPEAAQEVALVEDQVSIDDPPLVTDAGFAESDTVGTGKDAAPAPGVLCVTSPTQAANANGSIPESSKSFARDIENLIP